MTPAPPPRIPFWRDVRVIGVLAQVVSAAVTIGLVVFLFWTAITAMASRGIPFTFSFLAQEAGFSVSEGSILVFEDGRPAFRPFTSRDSYVQAFWVGLINTIRIAVIGIAMATVLGLLLGVARLSRNLLMNRLAFAYVELVRNTPLLLQMFFWYFAVFLKLPAARDAATWYGGVIVSNQGAALPGLTVDGPVVPFLLVVAVALIVGATAYVVAGRSARSRDRSTAVARPARSLALGLVGAVAVLATGVTIVGFPFAPSVPEMGRFRITGGTMLSPEFAAVLLGLVVYTSAFIAEVIRGAIQSVPHGQREAAGALGLRSGQTMRLIVLPQAIRIAIPPIGNLYLSLMKNTSLAVAVGYPDLFNVYKTIANQSGRSLEGVLIVMVVYLALSLAISAAINAYNRRVTRRWSA